MGYFSGELNERELALHIGAVSLIKGVLYVSGRREVSDCRKLESMLKEPTKINDEGEE